MYTILARRGNPWYFILLYDAIILLHYDAHRYMVGLEQAFLFLILSAAVRIYIIYASTGGLYPIYQESSTGGKKKSAQADGY